MVLACLSVLRSTPCPASRILADGFILVLSNKNDESLFMKFIILVFTTIGLSLTVNATELSGVVKSEDGKPLSGVEILTYAPAGPANILGMHVETSTRRYRVSTRADGSFSIPSHGRLVYFHRADLRPLTKIVDLATKQLEVTKAAAKIFDSMIDGMCFDESAVKW